jgi:hypothetical protein
MSGGHQEKRSFFTAFRFLLTKAMFGILPEVRFHGRPIKPAILCAHVIGGLRGAHLQGR